MFGDSSECSARFQPTVERCPQETGDGHMEAANMTQTFDDAKSQIWMLIYDSGFCGEIIAADRFSNFLRLLLRSSDDDDDDDDDHQDTASLSA